MGIFIKEGQITVMGSFFKRVADEVFSREMFYECYKNLIQVPKSNLSYLMLIVIISMEGR